MKEQHPQQISACVRGLSWLSIWAPALCSMQFYQAITVVRVGVACTSRDGSVWRLSPAACNASSKNPGSVGQWETRGACIGQLALPASSSEMKPRSSSSKAALAAMDSRVIQLAAQQASNMGKEQCLEALIQPGMLAHIQVRCFLPLTYAAGVQYSCACTGSLPLQASEAAAMAAVHAWPEH